MLIRKPSDLRYSDVTPKQDYLNRRRFIAGSLAVGALAGARPARATTKLSGVTKSQYTVDEKVDKITPLEVITSYNNFYEFGTEKDEPAENAKNFRTDPGPSRSRATSPNRSPWTTMRSTKSRRSKSASTGIAAWKPGPSWFPGSAFR